MFREIHREQTPVSEADKQLGGAVHLESVRELFEVGLDEIDAELLEPLAQRVLAFSRLFLSVRPQ